MKGLDNIASHVRTLVGGDVAIGTARPFGPKSAGNRAPIRNLNQKIKNMANSGAKRRIPSVRQFFSFFRGGRLKSTNRKSSEIDRGAVTRHEDYFVPGFRRGHAIEDHIGGTR